MNGGHNVSRNHVNSNYMTMIEQKTNSSQSASDCRTPIAWHNRSITLSKPMSLVQTPQPMATNYTSKYRSAQTKRLSQRPSSPSATTTSSDDRDEVPMVRHHMRRPNRYLLMSGSKASSVSNAISSIRNSRVTNSSALTVDRRHQMNKFGNHVLVTNDYSLHPLHAFRSGTLRSTKSVPTLAISPVTDSCPVHGGHGGHLSHANGLLVPNHSHHSFYGPMPSQTLNFRRFGSFTDIRDTRIPINGNGLPFLAPIPEHKQCGLMPLFYSQPKPSLPALPQLPALPAPNGIPMHLMQSKPGTMVSRPMVFPAYSEPVSFRNFKVSSPVSPVPSHQTIKLSANYHPTSEDMCCRGHLIVLWVILGVVTVGVISGIILAVTIN